MLNDIAEEHNCCVSVTVRVNPEKSKMNAKIKMSGVSSQFGIEKGSIGKDVIELVKKSE